MYDLVLVFAGTPDEDEDKLLACCAIAAEKITAAKRQDADENDPLLLAAAAGEAYYCYVTGSAGGMGEGESVKIGDLTVRNNYKTAVANAEKLRDELTGAARFLLSDEGFLSRAP